VSEVRKRCEANPFFVLGLPPSATAEVIEREGRKLLMQLSAGVGSAKVYETPFGTCERTEDLVRSALATLRDPDARLSHELWACSWKPDGAQSADGWPDAFRAAGFTSAFGLRGHFFEKFMPRRPRS
jgi:curved DNA-binding protein CbpA